MSSQIGKLSVELPGRLKFPVRIKFEGMIGRTTTEARHKVRTGNIFYRGIPIRCSVELIARRQNGLDFAKIEDKLITLENGISLVHSYTARFIYPAKLTSRFELYFRGISR